MIPYGRQLIEDDDIDAVARSLRGDYLTTGPKIAEFEQSLCAATGAKYAVVCANGTAALHMAALALKIGPGDAVIVPSVTFLATANAVRYVGAEVVFADVDPHTGLMGPDHLRAALARCGDLKPRAVFPVHLTGQCVDMAAIRAVAGEKNLAVVVDAAHALGSIRHGAKVGNGAYEDMTIFSFHPVKTITMGEGGAVTTNDAALADSLHLLRAHGMVRDESQGPWYYEMSELGFNYRATDMQCALGISQMAKLPRFAARRAELAARYDRLLEKMDFVRPPQRVPACEPVLHLYAVKIDFAAAGIERAILMKELSGRGVGTQVHYIPVHTQPYYQERYGILDLPGARAYYEQTLSLPLYPGMKDEDVDFVIRSLTEILS